MVAAQVRRRPRPADGRIQLLDPVAGLLVVEPVEFTGHARLPRRGCSSPTADRRTRPDANRFRTPGRRPSAARRHSRDGTGAVTTTWWRVPPAGIRPPADRADVGQLRAAGEHHTVGVDRAGRGVDSDDPTAGRAQAGEGAALADVDALRRRARRCRPARCAVRRCSRHRGASEAPMRRPRAPDRCRGRRYRSRTAIRRPGRATAAARSGRAPAPPRPSLKHGIR